MRLLIRVGTLVLAVVGIKALYERYGRRGTDAGTPAGGAVLDSATSAARELAEHAKSAAGEVAGHAKAAASEVAADARSRVIDVKDAAQTATETSSTPNSGESRRP